MGAWGPAHDPYLMGLQGVVRCAGYVQGLNPGVLLLEGLGSFRVDDWIDFALIFFGWVLGDQTRPNAPMRHCYALSCAYVCLRQLRDCGFCAVGLHVLLYKHARVSVG